MPNLSLPEVFCAFPESLEFHSQVQGEIGSKGQACQGGEDDRRSLHEAEAQRPALEGERELNSTTGKRQAESELAYSVLDAKWKGEKGKSPLRGNTH